jgi:RNA polymerase sigma-70 factor (ECF subfamily)
LGWVAGGTQHAVIQRGNRVSERDVDAELVSRVQAGDKQAFDLLVIKYQRKIMRLLSRMIRDPAEIEDVAQEAFIKAYRALPQFRGDSAFYTWLYRIAINTARNWLAANKRAPSTPSAFENEEGETFNESDVLTDGSDPESEMASRQIAETVNKAINDLPEELRNAIVMREIDGMSYEDIAESMNCPIGTVRSRIFRAREAIATRLRPLLGDTGDRRW